MSKRRALRNIDRVDVNLPAGRQDMTYSSNDDEDEEEEEENEKEDEKDEIEDEIDPTDMYDILSSPFFSS